MVQINIITLITHLQSCYGSVAYAHSKLVTNLKMKSTATQVCPHTTVCYRKPTELSMEGSRKKKYVKI